jgi:membrane-associated HD superfamily phosphohydrolase
MKYKTDTIGTGLILGILIPLISFFIFYFVKFSHYDFGDYVTSILLRAILTKILSLCVIPNLALFFIFIWTNKLTAARGVLTATIFLSIVMLLIKAII